MSKWFDTSYIMVEVNTFYVYIWGSLANVPSVSFCAVWVREGERGRAKEERRRDEESENETPRSGPRKIHKWGLHLNQLM